MRLMRSPLPGRSASPGLSQRLSFARVGRRDGRASRRWAQGAAMALALGLAFNGIALCLCAAGPAPAACDPQGCCPLPMGQHADHRATGTIATASDSCCPAHVAADLAARVVEREIVVQSLSAVAETHVFAAPPFVAPSVGEAAVLVSSPSRTRSPILRI